MNQSTKGDRSHEVLPLRHGDSSIDIKNIYDHLCKKIWTRCDFCDEYFPDRFSSIKHNASHIIIPLIKLTVHQCKECLFHFTSIKDLNTHIMKKYHKHSKSKVLEHDILKSMIEKQAVVKCKDEFGDLSIKINETSNKKAGKGKSNFNISNLDQCKITSVTDNYKLEDIIDICSDEESPTVKNSPKNSPNSALSIIEHGLLSPDRMSPDWGESALYNPASIENTPVFKPPLVNLGKISPERGLHSPVHSPSYQDYPNLNSEKINPPVKRIDNMYLSNPESLNRSKKSLESGPNKALSFSGMFEEFTKSKIDNRQRLQKIQMKSPLTVSTSQNNRPNVTTSQISALSVTTSQRSLLSVSPSQIKSPLTVSTIQMSPLNGLTSQKSPLSVSSSQVSPFDVSTGPITSSLSTLTTLSQEIKEEMIDYEPIKCRIKFEEDTEEMSEPEEILPDRPCVRKKVRPRQFCVSEPDRLIQNITNGLINNENSQTQTMNSQTRTMNSQTQTTNSMNETTNSLINTLKSEIQHADSQIQTNMNSLNPTAYSQFLTSILIPTPNSPITTSNILIPIPNSLIPTLKPDVQDQTVTSMDIEKPNYVPSIHFEELIELRDCKCRYCKLVFPNRIALIKHEPLHMRASRPRSQSLLCWHCDRHIAGNYHNLRRHVATKHPTREDRRLTFKRCPTCNLTYHNICRHNRNYHQMYNCEACGKYIEKDKIESHNCSDLPIVLHRDVSDIIRMCEICLVCARNQDHWKRNCRTVYDVLSEECVLGMKQKCDMCRNEFFSVNVVKRNIIYRENPSRVSEFNSHSNRHYRKKPMSNKDRLINIRKRIKMMKF